MDTRNKHVGLLSPKHARVCRICGEGFRAKHPRAQVCPEDGCQIEAKKQRDRARYLKQKAAREAVS